MRVFLFLLSVYTYIGYTTPLLFDTDPIYLLTVCRTLNLALLLLICAARVGINSADFISSFYDSWIQINSRAHGGAWCGRDWGDRFRVVYPNSNSQSTATFLRACWGTTTRDLYLAGGMCAHTSKRHQGLVWFGTVFFFKIRSKVTTLLRSVDSKYSGVYIWRHWVWHPGILFSFFVIVVCESETCDWVARCPIYFHASDNRNFIYFLNAFIIWNLDIYVTVGCTDRFCSLTVRLEIWSCSTLKARSVLPGLHLSPRPLLLLLTYTR